MINWKNFNNYSIGLGELIYLIKKKNYGFNQYPLIMTLLGHTSNGKLLPIEADQEQYNITKELKKLKW